MSNRTTDSQSVRSVTRALTLLSAVTRGPKTLTKLAQYADVSLSTASRLLGTLRQAGYVTQEEDGTYVSGPEITALIYSADQWSGARSLATRATTALREVLDETIAFFVRAGNERVCIESAESSRLVRRVCQPGERGPIHVGAAGKALLAFDPEGLARFELPGGATTFETPGGERSLDDLRTECVAIRKRGHSYSARETTDESWSVAAPVFRGGVLIGALTIVVPLTRSDDIYVVEAANALVAVAEKISGP
ncbi:IclR family transcriptional regulator [Streptomyces sp. NPDC004629]|uniref:IclR family transcriptional regulator n=1 Tax=Streptomyces sp. NPDC004629 TaxID=3364705 RepID=UPI0036AD0C35